MALTPCDGETPSDVWPLHDLLDLNPSVTSTRRPAITGRGPTKRTQSRRPSDSPLERRKTGGDGNRLVGDFGALRSDRSGGHGRRRDWGETVDTS